MENCACMQELISRMLDEDLNAGERAALAKHLEICPACRSMYDAFRAVSTALGDELEEPPESLCENVMGEIRRDEIRKKNRRPWRAVLSAAAVVVLVLGLRFGPGLRMGGAQMSTAVQEFAAVTEGEIAPEENAACEDAAVFEEVTASEESTDFEAAAPAEVYAASEKRAAAETAPRAANAAEEPALAGGAADEAINEAAMPFAAAGALADAAPAVSSAANAPAGTVIDLPHMHLEELLEALDGEPAGIEPELLEGAESLTVFCADDMLTLFRCGEDWYYFDPADPTPLCSALGPGELLALAAD